MVSLFIFLPSENLAQGGWLILPAPGFTARIYSIQWAYVTDIGGESYLTCLSTSSYPSFVAPVVFPPEADGLSARQINATVKDIDNNCSAKIQLYGENRYSGISQLVFHADTGIHSNTPGKIVITDIIGGYRLINSQKYAWFIKLTLDGVAPVDDQSRLYAVRIQYQ